jgi:hypothetical protein
MQISETSLSVRGIISVDYRLDKAGTGAGERAPEVSGELVVGADGAGGQAETFRQGSPVHHRIGEVGKRQSLGIGRLLASAGQPELQYAVAAVRTHHHLHIGALAGDGPEGLQGVQPAAVRLESDNAQVRTSERGSKRIR